MTKNVVDINKYPNPLRLFTTVRDTWISDMVESHGIPMYIFSSIRDTQLGQLMYAIETMRMRRERAGEDPGPGLLEGENATMFIPVFGLLKQYNEILEKLDADITKKLTKTLVKPLKKVEKKHRDWFSTLSQERLDEIYLASCEIVDGGIIQPLMEKLEIEDYDKLKEKLEETEPTFSQTFFSIYNPEILEKITTQDFEIEKEETGENTRIFALESGEEKLTYSDFHSRVNLLYAFIMEYDRYVRSEEYNYQFPMLEPLLTLENLLLYPQPDTQRLPLVKNHLEELKKSQTHHKSFYDILYASYQAYCRLETSNPNIVRKLLKNLEASMKDASRAFWHYVVSRQEDEKDQAEQLVALIWAHLRAVQTQAQHKEQQTGQHSHGHSATIRMEHIFWVQARDYIKIENLATPTQFWSAFSAIANKQVRKKEDSEKLFFELQELLQETKVLKTKKWQKAFDVQPRDQYSLLQRVLSYGLEARNSDIYPSIEEFVDVLEELLDNIDVNEMHDGFILDQEKEVVNNIRTHLKNPLPA